VVITELEIGLLVEIVADPRTVRQELAVLDGHPSKFAPGERAVANRVSTSFASS